MRPLLWAKTHIKPYIEHKNLFEAASEFKQRSSSYGQQLQLKSHMLG